MSLSRKFLKSLVRKQPQELLLVIGTGVSAAVAPGIPALCSWRSCIEAVIEAAEQLEVLHPGDVAEFRRKVTKDRDLLVVAHDLIRKMSPVSRGWAVCSPSLSSRGHLCSGCLLMSLPKLESFLGAMVFVGLATSLDENGPKAAGRVGEGTAAMPRQMCRDREEEDGTVSGTVGGVPGQVHRCGSCRQLLRASRAVQSLPQNGDM